MNPALVTLAEALGVGILDRNAPPHVRVTVGPWTDHPFVRPDGTPCPVALSPMFGAVVLRDPARNRSTVVAKGSRRRLNAALVDAHRPESLAGLRSWLAS